jgi:hypothetical protein
MKQTTKILSPAIVLLLSACASVTVGSDQLITVKTTPVEGSRCEIKNPKGTWVVERTPGTATISKARGEMVVTCSNQNGKTASRRAESDSKAEAFGNILIGGGIGAAADMATGAAYLYPAEIVVDLNGNNPPIVAVPDTKEEKERKADEATKQQYPD